VRVANGCMRRRHHSRAKAHIKRLGLLKRAHASSLPLVATECMGRHLPSFCPIRHGLMSEGPNSLQTMLHYKIVRAVVYALFISRCCQWNLDRRGRLHQLHRPHRGKLPLRVHCCPFSTLCGLHDVLTDTIPSVCSQESWRRGALTVQFLNQDHANAGVFMRPHIGHGLAIIGLQVMQGLSSTGRGCRSHLMCLAGANVVELVATRDTVPHRCW
jgi:hypothetical protein